MKKTLKNEKGITLIALIITVILMLILAMVALSAIGDAGLFEKTQNIADVYKKESQKEKELIQNLIEQVQEYGSNKSKLRLEYLTEKIGGEIPTSIEVDLNAILDENAYEEMTYEEYALEILEGMTPEKKDEIYVEATNYFENTNFTEISEVFQYEYEKGWNDVVFTSLEEMCVEYEYNDVNEMMIIFGYVKPQFFYPPYGVGTPNAILTVNGEKIGQGTQSFTEKYEITENGTYVFVLEDFRDKDSFVLEVNDFFDWNGAFEEAKQNNPNQDIALGTNGQVVDLSLWKYVPYDFDKTINLTGGNCGTGQYNSSYANSAIDLETGKIQGTMPQYIYLYEKDAIYTVTELSGTFYGCTNLKVAPEIPSTVERMSNTFSGCTNLTTISNIPNDVEYMYESFSYCSNLLTAPTLPTNLISGYGMFYNCTGLTTAPAIPSNVTDMTDMFYNCTNLTGTINVYCNPTDYSGCFNNAVKDTLTINAKSQATINDLISTGTSSKLLSGSILE